MIANENGDVYIFGGGDGGGACDMVSIYIYTYYDDFAEKACS